MTCSFFWGSVSRRHHTRPLPPLATMQGSQFFLKDFYFGGAGNNHISYHIISYHIISYHIISYHISYHIISYHIISYHIISYHIISYHIISYYSTAFSGVQITPKTSTNIPLLQKTGFLQMPRQALGLQGERWKNGRNARFPGRKQWMLTRFWGFFTKTRSQRQTMT